MKVHQISERSPELLAAIKAGMRRHAELSVPWEEYENLTFVVRDDDGELLGATLGESGRGWLHISVVWVTEQYRGQGVGGDLVGAIERAGIERGCHSAYLDTFSYQARPFYEKLGYEVFGVLDDHPPGHQRFYMRKKLRVRRSPSPGSNSAGC